MRIRKNRLNKWKNEETMLNKIENLEKHILGARWDRHWGTECTYEGGSGKGGAE
jgi:hypothetical protein